jgi:hypothetical protein
MRAESSNQGAFQKTIRLMGICLLVGILIYLLLAKKADGISVVVKDDHLSLSHSSGDTFDLRFKDILSVTEIQDLNLGKYVSGTDTKRYRFGIWDNDKFGEYKLCIYANVTRYIVVKTSNNIFVFNIESADATDSFYKAFQDLLQSSQAQSTP